jgi:hypothetical protein
VFSPDTRAILKSYESKFRQKIKKMPPETIIYSKPSETPTFMLGGLGVFLYATFFMIRGENIGALLALAIACFLFYLHIRQAKPQPVLILSELGIQVVGQPFVSWSLVHGLRIRPSVTETKYSETLVFVNNGRIQEFPLSELDITSWKLENYFDAYQEIFRAKAEELL